MTLVATPPEMLRISRQAAAVLHHPDQRTNWVVVAAGSLRHPIADARNHIVRLHKRLPMTGVRLGKQGWVPGSPAAVIMLSGDPLDDARLTAPFDLRTGPPVRVLLGHDGTRIAVAVHHAAFDGRGAIAILGALTGAELPQPRVSPAPSAGRGDVWSVLRRLARPVDRVAPSLAAPATESLASVTIELHGPDVTERLATACVAAAADHNRRRSSRWRRTGVTLGVGGPPGAGNVASYRRVDLAAGEPVAPAVRAALATVAEPAELVRGVPAFRLLRPLVDRLSDSLLVSNVGRNEMPGVDRLEFFPVARGRSAVAFGAAGLSGGVSTLSVRARDLSRDDADELLQAAAHAFEGGR